MVKYSVCPECEGEGYVGTLGAYAADEFREAFEDVDEYRALHEASLVACECCKGQRVVTAERMVDWDAAQAERREYESECRYGY